MQQQFAIGVNDVTRVLEQMSPSSLPEKATEDSSLECGGGNDSAFQLQDEVVNWNSGSYMRPCNSGELWLKGPGIMKGKKLKKVAFWGRMHMDVHVHYGAGAYIGVEETVLHNTYKLDEDLISADSLQKLSSEDSIFIDLMESAEAAADETRLLQDEIARLREENDELRKDREDMYDEAEAEMSKGGEETGEEEEPQEPVGGVTLEVVQALIQKDRELRKLRQ
ncbi:hypothetical protein IFM89_034858 [Coptis chinensis]|uniref:Uncharacterized protein n=1 Tax=Coptis chinensis TaxID=261450 RepID=A0A835I301_9MAGN|nr:hypothetical protein IFM89_034858 [Coptis chinensis]